MRARCRLQSEIDAWLTSLDTGFILVNPEARGERRRPPKRGIAYRPKPGSVIVRVPPSP